MKSFRELDVYRRASGLFPKVYKMVRRWELPDQRELGSQIIRAANSIHANVAEGWGKSPADFRRHLNISIGSCDELRSHLDDARNVGIMAELEHRELSNEYGIVGKQLTRLKQNWK